MIDYEGMFWLTEDKVRTVGGDPQAMDVHTVNAFDQFAYGMEQNGVKIVLMHNGMNSGVHTSKEHPEGKAIDFALVAKVRPPLVEIFARAAFCGFTGFGVYCNAEGYYSYHVHTGPRFASWTTKIIGKKRIPGALFNDPGGYK